MRRNTDTERGQIVVSTALLLTGLVGLAALATDMGFLYSSRTSSQAIADAAALAGAASFIFSPNAIQPDTARNRALATATAASILGETVETGEVNVAVDIPNRLVTVTLDRNEETFYGNVLGVGEGQIRTAAIAEAAPRPNGSTCTKPFFIPNTIFLDISACAGLSGQNRKNCIAMETCSECAEPPETSRLLVYKDNLGDYQVTPYAQTILPHYFQMRPTQSSEALGPSEFYSVRLGDSTGGEDYRTNIGSCPQEKTFCGECKRVETGNMVGPTNQGSEDLVSINNDQFFILPSGEVCFGQSSTDCSLNGSPQFATVPIWDNCAPPADACAGSPENFCEDDDGDGIPDTNFTGQPILKVVAYAAVFIEGWDSNGVNGQLVGINACAFGGPITNETGPLGVPLRLVTLPPGD